MKTLFFVLLAIWIGGGIFGGLLGGPAVQAFFANFFGIPTIIVGLILLWKKFVGTKEGQPKDGS